MSSFVLPITSVVASANVLLMIALAVLVVHHRIANNVDLGGAGIEPLERAIRAHANLIEYAPLALILLALLELNGLAPWQLWALGGLFTVARLSHVHGMLKATVPTRTVGALLSVILMLAMMGRLLTIGILG